MFISSLRLFFIDPSTDPVFPTDKAIDIDGDPSPWYYKSDPRYRVLICSDSQVSLTNFVFPYSTRFRIYSRDFPFVPGAAGDPSGNDPSTCMEHRCSLTVKIESITDCHASTRDYVPLMEKTAGHEQTEFPSSRLRTGTWTSRCRPRTRTILSPSGWGPLCLPMVKSRSLHRPPCRKTT